MPYTLEIVLINGSTFKHPYHLGTIDDVAYNLTMLIYESYQFNRVGTRGCVDHVRLMRVEHIIDRYTDGHWFDEKEI